MIKTTGAEFNQFYQNESFWKDGIYHEEEIMTLNGVDTSENDFPFDTVKDTDVITLSGGVILTPDGELISSFEGAFKKWRKAQTVQFLMVEIPKEKVEALSKIIIKEGGKIRK